MSFAHAVQLSSRTALPRPRREMEGIIQQNTEPRPGTAPMQMAALLPPGFRAQLLANLRRNFIIYNRAPEYSEWAGRLLG